MSYPDLDYKIASFEGLLLSLGKKPKVEQSGETKVSQNSNLSLQKDIFSKGKGANQAVAAKRLGAAVRFVGRLGRDGHGEWCHGWRHGELGG